ncbi:MAG: MarR family transcriptional regulator [Spirochaetales bacterium]
MPEDSTDLSDPAQLLLRALLEFQQVGFRHHAPGQLGRTEFGVLMALKHQGEATCGMRIGDLVRLLESSPPTMTQTTTSLARLGLVERVADAQDRRVVRIVLTAAGRESVLQRQQGFHTYCTRLAGFLGDDDSLKLVELLKKMAQFMQTDPISQKEQRL